MSPHGRIPGATSEHQMSPSYCCGVMQVSGGCSSPICLGTMTLTPCFYPKYPLSPPPRRHVHIARSRSARCNTAAYIYMFLEAAVQVQPQRERKAELCHDPTAILCARLWLGGRSGCVSYKHGVNVAVLSQTGLCCWAVWRLQLQVQRSAWRDRSRADLVTYLANVRC